MEETFNHCKLKERKSAYSETYFVYMLSSITVSQCASAHDSVENIAPSERSIRENMHYSLWVGL